MLVSGHKEVTEALVKLDDVPSCLIGRLLKFCYEPQTYPMQSAFSEYLQDVPQQEWEDDFEKANGYNYDAARLAVKLYELADRFEIIELKSKSRVAFLRAWCNADSSVHEEGHLADEYDFTANDFKHPQVFAEIMREVYTTTPSTDRGLRDIAFRPFHWYIKRHYHFKPMYRCFKQLIEELPDLALDLALHDVSELIYDCEECDAENRFVLRPCSCDKAQIWCEDDACIAERRARSFCLSCSKVEVFEPHPVGEEDAEQEDEADED